MAKHNEIGKIGEDLAVKWLIGRGYVILQRNYRKNFGEIDIVARGTYNNVHFIEVKCVSYETRAQLEGAVSSGEWRPEENVHFHKQSRLSKTIEVWISEHHHESDWQIDIVAVRLVSTEKYAQVRILENVVFED